MSASLSLLIVEDDPDTLDLYRSILTLRFPTVKIFTAMTADEAISSFKEFRHDVIVSDYRVPNKHDGLRIAKAICSEHPEAVVFIVTADAHVVSAIMKGSVAGDHCIHGVFAKPVNLRELMRKIDDALKAVAES